MLMLKRPNVFLPGGFSFTQELPNGQKMLFDGNTPLKAQIRKVAAVRRANNLPRASLAEVAEDVAAVVCARHPGNCLDSTQTANNAATVRRVTGGCGTCGGRRRTV